MKTDLVEIFQTIRAGLQPYASRGYTVHENSENGYDLYSEKNIELNGEKVTERFFTGVYINGDTVEVKINTDEFSTTNHNLNDFGKNKAGLKIAVLDDPKLKEIETLIEIIHTNFKEKEWI
ncbi:hypothetical protein H9N25_08830 [Pedobacter riviphilus]|uniref:DUF1801 domain-containing protein n=1 Tax=Pedobacter riviphilus TaxID=2766984 RepID=A0ABX6TMG6_9SPHI|nr:MULTISPECIES: hypothetical protein [Pedobacter]NII82782.1 hypothetical protein [Pedobacter sp. SG908]NMN36800.1 hypothetical protein [Pedobacter sp. SG918]QNR86477.1 hypothetical protein H9N25_08830 [Pedobacter riviphilus]